jgi:hypothetical protein
VTDVWYDKDGVQHTGPRPGAKPPGTGEPRNEGTLLPPDPKKPAYEKMEGEPTRDQFESDEAWLAALNAYRAAKQKEKNAAPKKVSAKSQADALENV